MCGKFSRWWSLDCLGKIAGISFGAAGTIVALSAANFFFLVSRVSHPDVATGVVLNNDHVAAAYGGKAPNVVLAVTGDFTTKLARSIADPSAKDAYLNALAKANAINASRPSESPLHPLPPEETRLLSGSDLRFAYATLRAAAIPVAVVKVTNSGHATALNVQITTPVGLVGEETVDRAEFDLDPGQHRTLLFRPGSEAAEAPTSGPGVLVSTQGFEATATTDPLVSQSAALEIMAGAAVLILLTMLNDFRRFNT